MCFFGAARGVSFEVWMLTCFFTTYTTRVAGGDGRVTD